MYPLTVQSADVMLQRIVGAVSCDLIAGTEVKTFFKPSTPAHLFPLPGGSEPEAIEVDQLDELDVDDNVSDEGNLELGGDVSSLFASDVKVGSSTHLRHDRTHMLKLRPSTCRALHASVKLSMPILMMSWRRNLHHVVKTESTTAITLARTRVDAAISGA